MSEAVGGAYDAVAELYRSFAIDDLDRIPTDGEQLRSFAALAACTGLPAADLGCGPGHVVDQLARLGLSAVGFDISPGMIHEARQAFPDAEFHVGDLTALDIPDATLGGLVARYSLIHMPPERLAGIFAGWARMLAPDAPVLVSFFAASNADDHGSPFDHKVTTAYQLFPPTIAARLRAAGFDRIEVTTRPPIEGERNLDHGTVLAQKSATG